MKIKDYFQQIREAIDNCPVAQSSSVNYDKRGTYVGFIRGGVYFVDSTILHLREFVNLQKEPKRLVYAYQYMTADHQSRQHSIARIVTQPAQPRQSSKMRYPFRYRLYGEHHNIPFHDLLPQC